MGTQSARTRSKQITTQNGTPECKNPFQNTFRHKWDPRVQEPKTNDNTKWDTSVQEPDQNKLQHKMGPRNARNLLKNMTTQMGPQSARTISKDMTTQNWDRVCKDNI